MIINLIFDQPTNTLPTGFVTALNAAVQFLESLYSDPITINLDRSIFFTIRPPACGTFPVPPRAISRSMANKRTPATST